MARSRRSSDDSGGAGESREAAPSAPSFEVALSELEAVVGRLESGELPLEQALEAFESGVKLSRQCAATLDAAERRIEILMAERGDAGARVESFGMSRRGARDESLDTDAEIQDPDAEDGER